MYGRALVVAVATLAACSPVITSSADYRTAGARTAGDASAQAASAQAAGQLAIDRRAFSPYLTVVVSDAEGALSGIESTFSELQPPTAADEQTRQEVLDAVGQTLDTVSELRIAIAQGHVPSQADIATLQQLQDQLDALAGELS